MTLGSGGQNITKLHFSYVATVRNPILLYHLPLSLALRALWECKLDSKATRKKKIQNRGLSPEFYQPDVSVSSTPRLHGPHPQSYKMKKKIIECLSNF